MRAQLTVSTGIAGLDTLLRGGLPADRMYLVQGRPGTGKTTIAMQFLLEGAARASGACTSRSPRPPTSCAALPRRTGGPSTASSCSSCRHRTTPPARTLHAVSPGRGRAGRGPGAAGVDRPAAAGPHRPGLAQRAEAAGPRSAAVPPANPRVEDLLRRHGYDRAAARRSRGGDEDSQLQSLSHGVLLLEQLPSEYGRARRRVRSSSSAALPPSEGFHDFTISSGGIAVFPADPAARPGRRVAGPLESGIGTGPAARRRPGLGHHDAVHRPGRFRQIDARQAVPPSALADAGLALPVRRAHATFLQRRRAGDADVRARARPDGDGADRARPALAGRVQPPRAAQVDEAARGWS